MPTAITAPRINSNMAPSKPFADMEIEAADGEDPRAEQDLVRVGLHPGEDLLVGRVVGDVRRRRRPRGEQRR